jgi:hypothetical protein
MRTDGEPMRGIDAIALDSTNRILIVGASLVGAHPNDDDVSLRVTTRVIPTGGNVLTRTPTNVHRINRITQGIVGASLVGAQDEDDNVPLRATMRVAPTDGHV